MLLGLSSGRTGSSCSDKGHVIVVMLSISGAGVKQRMLAIAEAAVQIL